jgi:hypothetical protein
MIEFADSYDKEEHGWILFPRDTGYRRATLGPAYTSTSKHPAKMNAHLLLEVVQHLTQPGDLILDPFGGIGTTLFATTLGRDVTTVEIEEVYAKAQYEVIESMRDSGVMTGNGFCLNANSPLVLPIKCDHIITSPPYGNDLASSRASAVNEEQKERQYEYTANPQNIGRLNPFLYGKTMYRLYGKMVDSLNPRGTITITHRDRRRGEERILYGPGIIKQMSDLGMKLYAWHKWKAPGSIQSRVNEAQGVEVILDEDILMFRKPD